MPTLSRCAKNFGVNIPFALIEVIYLLGGVLGFKVAVAKLKDGYIDIWKYCQVFATRHVIDVFVFCDNHSKWFDSLFHKRRIYFCDVYPKSKDYHDELIDRANYIGATVMKRDVTELRMKWWCRSRTIYLISDDDNENTEQAVFLQNACMRSKTQKKILNCNKTEIYVFASNYESEFVIDDLNNKIVKDRVDLINDMITKGGRIDNESFDIMRIRRVNEYNNFATNFFWNRYGKFFDDTDNEINELNVVFIGCGKYGREFVKTLCCLGQLPNYRLTINIFDRDIEKVKASLPKALLQNGGLPLSLDSQSDKGGPIYAITFEQCLADVSNVDFLNNVMLNPTHVFVMLGDDELNIRTAMLLRTKLRRENNNLKPKIYAVVNDYQRHYNLKQGDALYKYDIRPIGRTITRYSEQAIQQKYIERWAKVVHTSFLLNDKLSDVLCSNSDDYSFKNYCEKYRKERGCEIPESFFDLLKQINVNPVIDISYPVFLHKMYRSWQKVVADKIKDVDISNIYEMRNLVCEILNNMVVSSEDNSIYINAIIDKVRRLNKDYSIDVNTVEDLVKGLLDELPRWRDDLQQRVTANKIIELTDYFSFDKREYFRRSSKSRALYEHILLGKQMIKYTPESHSVKINKNLSKIRFSDSVWESLEKDMNYSALGINDNDSQQKILLQWETGQWYVLNDLMQKRWMAFMWGEGYIYQSFDDKTGRTDIIEKTHKYLKPYIDIFNSDSDRIRQTMEIILVDK